MSGDNGNSSSRSNTPWRLPSNSGGPRLRRVGAGASGGSSSPGSGNSTSGGPRIATLRNVGNGGGSGPPLGSMRGAGGMGGGHVHADEDDGNNDENQGESWLADGERSGISVQNTGRPGGNIPGGDLVRNLLRRAAENGPTPEAFAAPSRSTAFRGGGQTLGSDEVDSQFIAHHNAPTEPVEETAIRRLTFWREGFSIGDGELMRYDDPANVWILDEINLGRAPPRILNVNPGRLVELRVIKRLQDDFVSVPIGQDNRPDSPIPGETSASASASAGTSSAPAPTSSGGQERESFSSRFEVYQTKPMTSVQIRLADGTRLVCRMNLTDTVRDIRNFISASRPENSAQAYTIGTMFPNRTLEDDSQTIEQAGLVNSVVVQQWVSNC